MILLDLAGSGFSGRPRGFSYSIEGHARTVAELVAYLAPDEIDLFGHSMGGSVAVTAGHIIGGRIRSLLLSEPNLDPGGGFFSRKIAQLPEEDYVLHGHHALVSSSETEGNIIWASSLATSAPYAIHRGARSLVAGSNPTWRELLYDLAIPRTVIFGEASLPDPDAERLQQNRVNVSIVRDAGHSMAWENPSGLAMALGCALQ